MVLLVYLTVYVLLHGVNPASWVRGGLLGETAWCSRCLRTVMEVDGVQNQMRKASGNRREQMRRRLRLTDTQHAIDDAFAEMQRLLRSVKPAQADFRRRAVSGRFSCRTDWRARLLPR